MAKITFEGLGWKSKVKKNGNSYSIRIPKLVIAISSLEKGDKIQQFFVKIDNKAGLLIVLDKNGLSKETVRGE